MGCFAPCFSLHSRAWETATGSAGTLQPARRRARQTLGNSLAGSSRCDSGASIAQNQRAGCWQQEWQPASLVPSRSRLTPCAAATGGGEAKGSSAWPSSSASTASRELASRLSAPSAVQHSSDVKHMPAAALSALGEAPLARAAPDTPPASSSAGNCTGGGHNAGAAESDTPAASSIASSGGSGGHSAAAAEAAAHERPPTDQPADQPADRKGGRKGGRGKQQPDEHGADRCEHPPESGIVPDAQLSEALSDARVAKPLHAITTDVTLSTPPRVRGGRNLFLPSEKSQIRDSWRKIMRWSKVSLAR